MPRGSAEQIADIVVLADAAHRRPRRRRSDERAQPGGAADRLALMGRGLLHPAAVNMRSLVLCLFVVFAALALGGCPVFTRGSGVGRPIADGQQP